MSIKPIQNELVVNWHITEACNYSCKYCYAHWKTNKRELIHHPHKVNRLIEVLAEHFQGNSSNISENSDIHCNTIRLNIAGGEPFLYPEKVATIVRRARNQNMRVSCITNGSKLTPAVIEKIVPHMSVVGISMDSATRSHNNAIGRSDRNGSLSTSDYRELFRLIRNTNPDAQLKINTVVNEINWTEDMNNHIGYLRPDKWKIFKVLPVCGAALSIGDREYNSFLKRHSRHTEIITAENNDAMTHSYLMIDPLGRFYQNQENLEGYEYSLPILDVGVKKALEQVNFSTDKFIERYKDSKKNIYT